MRKPITNKTLAELDELRKLHNSFWDWQEAIVEDPVLSWFQEHGADYYTYVKSLERDLNSTEKELRNTYEELHRNTNWGDPRNKW